ncbi:MAG TPA: peptidylprolyl isomerase [Nitrospirae bacterium]|nr:peptidylprolyl isomerase [Nitrospirota bacterium]
MGQRAVVIVIVLALAVGSSFFFYSKQAGAPQPATGSQQNSAASFGLDKQAENPEPLKIDFNAIPDIIAEIDGVPIGKAGYVLALKGFQRSARKFGAKVDKEAFQKVKKDIIASIISRETFLHEASKENIKADEAVVAEKLAQVKAGFPDQKIFQNALKEQGLTEDFLKKEIVKAVIIQSLVEKNILSAINITDEALRNYYDLNQLEFEKEEMIQAAHILARADAKSSPEEKKKARERIGEIKRKLNEGADFGKLASTESDDKAAAANKGDLGTFSKGQMVEEFSKAAFSLEPGEISDIVETQFGYHLIKVTKKVPAKVVPFEEAKDSIKAKLTQKITGEKIREYIKRLKKEFNVKVMV